MKKPEKPKYYYLSVRLTQRLHEAAKQGAAREDRKPADWHRQLLKAKLDKMRIPYA